MKITEVEIDFTKPKNGIIAFASIVLDDELHLSGIAIHRKFDGSGYRLTYPTRRIEEQQIQLFHPIRRPLSHAIEAAILQKLKDVVSKARAGHNRNINSTHSV